ncbi:MAG: hypothetical protein AB2805_09005 [Candidatus Thiodiazotropha sp.]
MAEGALNKAMAYYHFDDVDKLMALLEHQHMDGQCEATDGCIVEPDGHCPHGKPSWLIKLGII